MFIQVVKNNDNKKNILKGKHQVGPITFSQKKIIKKEGEKERNAIKIKISLVMIYVHIYKLGKFFSLALKWLKFSGFTTDLGRLL